LNIVLIFADQMHKYALGKVSPFIHTPNLDYLCKNGVMFTNAYSNNPVCTPFRGVLFTGLYSSCSGVRRNNDPLLAGVITMADAFNRAGYETSFVGKWHLGGAGNGPVPEDLRGGFRHFIGYQCYNGFYNDVHFYDETNHEHRFREHREDVATRLAVDRLKMLHDTGKPFLHVIGYQAPHYPVQPSLEFEQLYSSKTIPYDPDYKETDPYTPTFSPYSPRPFEKCPDYQRYGGNMQEYMRLYYGMVSQIDAGVGGILHCLDELGIRENTVVIFTSDHGDMQGSHGLLNKCLPYEKSCGIPLIISAPDGVKNRECAIPVSGLDLFPTCLDYAGIPINSHLQ
jgi:arylsulfatase A-like enzyme